MADNGVESGVGVFGAVAVAAPARCTQDFAVGI